MIMINSKAFNTKIKLFQRKGQVSHVFSGEPDGVKADPDLGSETNRLIQIFNTTLPNRLMIRKINQTVVDKEAKHKNIVCHSHDSRCHIF